MREKWTTEEDDVLKELYPTGGSAAVAAVLSQTNGAVRMRAFRLGVKREGCRQYAEGRTMREDWTQVELEKLFEYYPVMGAREASKRIGRSVAAVYQQVHRQGLTKAAGGQGSAPRHNPVRESKWARRLLDIQDRSCELHKQRVMIEVQSRHVLDAGVQHEEFAVFRIFPVNPAAYWAEYG